MLKNRIAKLEQSIKEQVDRPRVYFVEEDTAAGMMEIPDLDFDGTSEEGRKLMQQYPHCTFIVNDIPRGTTEC